MNDKYFEDFTKKDIKGFAEWLNKLNAYEFSLLATTIGFLISPALSINEQNSLGNFFELIGQVMLTISAQKTTIKHKQNQNTTLNMESIKNIYEEINRIKLEVVKLRNDALNN